MGIHTAGATFDFEQRQVTATEYCPALVRVGDGSVAAVYALLLFLSHRRRQRIDKYRGSVPESRVRGSHHMRCCRTCLDTRHICIEPLLSPPSHRPFVVQVSAAVR